MLFRRLVAAFFVCIGLVQTSSAASVLVLSTSESQAFIQSGYSNAISEFTNAGATVVSNNTELSNGTAMSPSIFNNAGQKFDAVMIFAVSPIDPQDWPIINNAIATKAAGAFYFFVDSCCGIDKQNNGINFINMINSTSGWGVQYGTSMGGPVLHASPLNQGSSYKTSFGTAGLNAIYGDNFVYLNNIPADNALYLKDGVSSTLGQDRVEAYSAFIPAALSYGGTGACVFATTDVNPWLDDGFSSYNLNKGKIGPAFLNAVSASGVCEVSLIKKEFSPNVVTPGANSSLTISVVNPSATHAISALNVTDRLPSPLKISGTVTSTCLGASPVVNTDANGVDIVSLTGATLPIGGCTITVPVLWPNSSAGIAACGMGNTVTNTITPLGIDGVVSADDQFSTSEGVINTPATATLGCRAVALIDVTKETAVQTVTPGGNVSYDIVVENKSLVAASNVSVTDSPPSNALTSLAWSCMSSDGTSCPSPLPVGDLNQTGLTIPAGVKLTFTLNATVVANPPASFTNEVEVTPGTGLCFTGNTSTCKAKASLPPVGMVAIRKRASEPTQAVFPNSTVAYTVVVSNVGNVLVSDINVSDPLPEGILGGTWTCSGSCTTGSGTLPLIDTLQSLAVGSSATYLISAQTSSTLPSQIINQAHATPKSPQVCEGGRTPPCNAIAVLQTAPSVLVTKTSSTPQPVKPGSDVSYTITVTNSSGTQAAGLMVSDPLPDGLTSGSWSCTGICGQPNGNLPLVDTIPMLMAGESAAYSIHATAALNNLPKIIVNEVSVSSSSKSFSCFGGKLSPCQARASLSAEESLSIPSLGKNALILLTLCMLALIFMQRKRMFESV